MDITLVREVDGGEQELQVDVWHDEDAHLYCARVMSMGVGSHQSYDHFSDGVKTKREAVKVAREIVEKLRAEGWKDELTREEQARVDASFARWKEQERLAEQRLAERVKAFPVTPLDKRLADAIANPEGVTELELRGREGNRISVIPPAIKKLKQLEVLHLEGNALEELPDELDKLNALRALHLAHNRLTDVPRGVWYLRKLVVLDLHDNRFPKMDRYFGDYQKKGLELQIAGNPIEPGACLGPFDKLVTLGVDTAALFPIGERAGDSAAELTTLHLYGDPPTHAQQAELASHFPKAKVETFAHIEDGPRILTKLAPLEPKPTKKFAAPVRKKKR